MKKEGECTCNREWQQGRTEDRERVEERKIGSNGSGSSGGSNG